MSAAVAFTLTTALPLLAQRPTVMTANDLATLTAPPPAQRIAYGSEPLQFGNLRLPSGAGPHPVVVFLHGGCWLAQYSIDHAAALEQGLADAGYAVWSLEYRRVGNEGGGWPGTFLDVARGADYLRTIASTYHLDLSRVVAAGHSAGGQLALWLAARPKLLATSELYLANPLAVRGVLGLAPAPDLESLDGARVCGHVIGKLMGGAPNQVPDRYRDVSPMQLAPIGVPQRLVLGKYDDAWGPNGLGYFRRATSVGDTLVRMVEAPESGHFEVIAPKSSTWPIVVQALRELIAPK